MKIIEFNNNYPKLQNQSQATLISVTRQRICDLPHELVKYDTLRSDGTYYNFTPGENILCLVFFGTNLFTTIRKDNTHNAHYLNEVGENFNIEIKEMSNSFEMEYLGSYASPFVGRHEAYKSKDGKTAFFSNEEFARFVQWQEKMILKSISDDQLYNSFISIVDEMNARKTTELKESLSLISEVSDAG